MTKENCRLSINVTPELMEGIKKLEERQPFKPSRCEMVRRLLAIGIREMLKVEE